MTRWKPSESVIGTLSGRRNVRPRGLEPFLISAAAALADATGTPLTETHTSPTLTPAWAAPPCDATNVTTGRVLRQLMIPGSTALKIPPVSSEAL